MANLYDQVTLDELRKRLIGRGLTSSRADAVIKKKLTETAISQRSVEAGSVDPGLIETNPRLYLQLRSQELPETVEEPDLSEQQGKWLTARQSAEETLGYLNEGKLSTGPLAAKLERRLEKLGKAGQSKERAALGSAAINLGYALSGAQIPPAEMERIIADMGPSFDFQEDVNIARLENIIALADTRLPDYYKKKKKEKEPSAPTLTPTQPQPELPGIEKLGVGERKKDLLPDFEGTVAQKGVEKIKSVSDYILPETTKLFSEQFEKARKSLRGEEIEKPDLLQYLTPYGVLFSKDQVGKASKEIGSAILLDFLILGAVSKIKPLVGKVTGPVKNILKSFVKANPAARTFISRFTIPTKLANRLKPIQTADEMLKYDLGGKGIPELTKAVNDVTGADGFLSKATRNAAGAARKEIDMSDVYTTVNNTLKKSSIPLTRQKEIRRTITNMVSESGKEIGKMAPIDAFDIVRQLEARGYEHLSASTYLTKRITQEQIGKVFLNASDELMHAMEVGLKNEDVFSKIVTPELIEQGSRISARLGEQVSKVKTIKDLRALQAPFVRLGKMMALTEQASLSAAVKFGQGVGRGGSRIATALGGQIIAGPLGAVAGYAAGPALQTIAQQAEIPMTTAVAQAMKKGIPQAIKASPTIGKIMQWGTKVGITITRATAQLIRAELQRQTGLEEQRGLPDIEQGELGNVNELLQKNREGQFR